VKLYADLAADRYGSAIRIRDDVVEFLVDTSDVGDNPRDQRVRFGM